MSEAQPLRSEALVETPDAARYLGQLCKHFQHKLPVSLSAEEGRIEFPMGECRVHASPGQLRLAVAATDAEELARLQDVVARHLLRFAFRAPPTIEWRAG
jgi:hypothetical protein